MGFFHGNYYGNIMGAPILKENNKSIHGQDQGTRCFIHSLETQSFRPRWATTAEISELLWRGAVLTNLNVLPQTAQTIAFDRFLF